MEAFQRYFIDVITKNFANFNGRARRKEYWMFFLFSILTGIIITFIDILIFDEIFFQKIYIAGIFLPNVSLSVRRLHDIGKRWTWLLINIIPIIGSILLTVLMATKGMKGDNEFGPDPKGKSII